MVHLSAFGAADALPGAVHEPGLDEVAPASQLSDAEMALALQLDEMEAARRIAEPGVEESPEQFEDMSFVTERLLTDAVWGEVHFTGTGPSRCQVTIFSCCPCWTVGCGCYDKPAAQERQPIAKRDVRRAWKRFIVSFATLFSSIQLLAFVVVLVLGEGFASPRVNPMLGPHAYILNDLGAKNAARILEYGEWWRLLSPMFLHGGIIHLLANLAVQLRLGVLLEVLWGHGVWLQVYFASGMYSSLASCCLLPDALGVGSSGGICGLIGAGITFLLCTWGQTLPRDVTERNVQLASLTFTVLLTLAMSSLPMVDLAAHAGGFLSGGLLGVALFADRLQGMPCIRRMTQVTGAVLFLALFGLSGIYLVFVVKPDPKLLRVCKPSGCG